CVTFLLEEGCGADADDPRSDYRYMSLRLHHLTPLSEPRHLVADRLKISIDLFRRDIVDVVERVIADLHLRIANGAQKARAVLSRRIAKHHRAPSGRAVSGDGRKPLDVGEARRQHAVN